jgi:geranylgeranyl diphosphate synthase type I
MDRVHQMLVDVAAGQQLDILQTIGLNAKPEMETALKICQYKTASYSVEAPLQFGAILAGAEPQAVAGWQPFAQALGTAFQIQDDLLDIFGDPARLGKPTMGDVVEGKLTTVILLALDELKGEDRQLLHDMLVADEADVRRLGHLRAVLKASTVEDKAQKLIDNYIAKSLGNLSQLKIKAEVAVALDTLVKTLVGRQA